MDERQQQEIAQAFDATPELLPFIPELLADLWALGGSVEVIVDILRPLRLPAETTRILDLGCGKGAVTLTLAKEFGFQVVGVDLFEPFVQEAKVSAEEMGIASQCQFFCEDIRDTIIKARDYDVAIYASVGGVLGKLDECVAKLRECVHPGGYILINDGFLTNLENVQGPWYEHCTNHHQTLHRLSAHGDTLIREVIISTEDIKELNRQATELICKRAERLVKIHPQYADSFYLYVKKQERESKIMESIMTVAVWLLQRQ